MPKNFVTLCIVQLELPSHSVYTMMPEGLVKEDLERVAAHVLAYVVSKGATLGEILKAHDGAVLVHEAFVDEPLVMGGAESAG